MKKGITNAYSRLKKNGGRKLALRTQRYLELPYRIELVPIVREDGGGYLASIPLLKGCQSDGKTPDEAIRNLREAQQGWIESAIRNGDPVPIPQDR
jgi:antitoxin HicB